jgi:hypothetical protein
MANIASRRFHDGAVIPDKWVPVVVGTSIGNTCVALRIGTGGGGSFTATFDADGASATFANVQDGEVIDGRFNTVTAATVSDILAAIVL